MTVSTEASMLHYTKMRTVMKIFLPNQFPVKYGTDRYLHSFFPDATKNWNYIITDFKEIPTFEVLKKHLISLYRPAMRSTFNIHNPQLRYIFQLKVGLSHLRSHKKRHRFADNPSDKCLYKMVLRILIISWLNVLFTLYTGMLYLLTLKLYYEIMT